MPTRKDEPMHTHSSKFVFLPSLYLTRLSLKSYGNSIGKQNHIVMGLVCWAISIHCRYIYETILLSLYCYGLNGNIHSLGVWLRLTGYWDLYVVAIWGPGSSKGWMSGLWGFGFSGGLFRIPSAHSLTREIWLSLSLCLLSVPNARMASPIRQTCWVSQC